MRLGFIFDDHYTDWILTLSDYMGTKPYDFLIQAIDAMAEMYEAELKDD